MNCARFSKDLESFPCEKDFLFFSCLMQVKNGTINSCGIIVRWDNGGKQQPVLSLCLMQDSLQPWTTSWLKAEAEASGSTRVDVRTTSDQPVDVIQGARVVCTRLISYAEDLLSHQKRYRVSFFTLEEKTCHVFDRFISNSQCLLQVEWWSFQLRHDNSWSRPVSFRNVKHNQISVKLFRVEIVLKIALLTLETSQ